MLGKQVFLKQSRKKQKTVNDYFFQKDTVQIIRRGFRPFDMVRIVNLGNDFNPVRVTDTESIAYETQILTARSNKSVKEIVRSV